MTSDAGKVGSSTEPAHVTAALADPERFWDRAAAALASIPADDVTVPPSAKVGAVLVLVADTDNGPELVLTRRRADMRSHPGQVSFPGGRVDDGETIVEAALREANEEVDLDPATAQVVGPGPVFYIPPSRFWVAPVLARWTSPHPLDRNPWEVDKILRVPLRHLVDDASWRAVPLSAGGATWAWELPSGDLLWGATAITVAQLLEVVVPGWRRGVDPADLDEDHHERPWESIPRTAPRRMLDGDLPSRAMSTVPTVDVATVRALDAAAQAAGWPLEAMSEQAGRGVAHAVRRLLAPASLGGADVVVLAGSGGNGAAGLVAARLLVAAGCDVRVVVVGREARVAVPGQVSLLDRLDVPVLEVADVDPAALDPGDVVVDAMVGIGASPPLRDGPEVLGEWLRRHDRPVVAVDLPSGLGGDVGLRGPGVTADVTVTIGLPKTGLLPRIVQPYVGDLYLADLGIPPQLWAEVGVEVPADLFVDGPLVRLVPDDGVASDAGTPDQGATTRTSPTVTPPGPDAAPEAP
ncbi:NAD(P)H-hydrate epimerase [Salsipaludibacter albus]|uniref:NAD(P)H-hydrate epimerase n=1 Tax=Salsipaludibacter albus TaxID=2849650 RepID=UPI001EE3B961|nr:NAD(P)H-hydrate epimerase [Salsipaludibacter albus]MBY5161892.1 NAD(P)H-hydrate epimerase [Salsipaludibacter albus]